MSSRKSARLSAAAAIVPAPAKEVKPRRANISKKRKLATEEDSKTRDSSPSTPRKKRPTKTLLPPVTPTPAAIELMAMPYSSGDIDDMAPPPKNRLVVTNGNLTNAPLITPETHRLVANMPMDQISPSKAPNIKESTGDVLQKALAHLIRIEPKLEPIIDRHPCHVFSPEGLAEQIDPFRTLTSGIISQQVSGAAAKSIKAKFVALFNIENSDPIAHSFPTPSQVCASTTQILRTAGLSQRKAEYVHGLAEKFNSGELTTEMLFSASYDEVLQELIKVRGLGKWSVEMFACFGLKRLDVFSTGDLGVQKGMAVLLGRDVGKLKSKKSKWKFMSEKEMEEIAERFKPYRSVFMWYMWKVLEVEISAIET